MSSLGSEGDQLLWSSIGLVEQFVRWPFDDTASDGELSSLASEVRISVSCSHAAFVNPPVDSVSHCKC